MNKTLFIQKRYNKLNYCEYIPKINRGEKVPLVLFLHGGGERGSDNKSQLKNAILKVINKKSTSKFMNSVVIAPQCPLNIRWVNTLSGDGNYTLAKVEESKLMKQVVSLVKSYMNLDFIDKNRVYVIGLSIGGFGTWDLLARHSDIFTAGVPICGGGPTDAINILKNIPIYTFHGTNDFVVPYSGTKEMVDLIIGAGGTKINFVSFKSAGHNVWDDAIIYDGDRANPNLEDWLFNNRNR
ncbi:MAG: prolyl oligopeptidase family serine peptidase [Erysipelotrichales bacterium]|nr:prolyl oligopeptidase family serine peptidase [Erysipelotrichales bacterium]